MTQPPTPFASPGDDSVLADLIARAPAYDDAFVVPYDRDTGGGFQRCGGAVLAVIHDPDLLALLDHLWKHAARPGE